MPLATVTDAIAAYRQGQFVIIVDDENRENEGDLAIAADWITPQAVNFCAVNGRGLICIAMAGALIDRFKLSPMTPPDQNRSKYRTPFTISVEAASGVTTGISARDRAHTMRTLIDPAKGPRDIVSPGHVFPLRAREGGVLERRGQTEASVDLAQLAGLTPAAMICEIMNEDGTMARMGDLEAYAEKHDLLIVSVDAIAKHRRAEQAGHANELSQAI